MKLILLNSSNFISDNQLEFKFQGAYQINRQDRLAFKGGSLFNSFFNIGTEYNNTDVLVTFPSKTPITVNWHIEDGFYTNQQLSDLLQQFCLDNGFYTIDEDTSDTNFYISIFANPSTYKIEIQLLSLPTVDVQTASSFQATIASVNSMIASSSSVAAINDRFDGYGSSVLTITSRTA